MPILRSFTIFRYTNLQLKLKGFSSNAMAPKGVEVIIGMKRDPQFGPLLMFGLGGIYVELFGDVSFRIAPLTRADVMEMIQETKAGHLLAGMRGYPAADIEAVTDCILKLAQISLDYPEIEEIEINPLLVLEAGHGAIALDARAIIQQTLRKTTPDCVSKRPASLFCKSIERCNR